MYYILTPKGERAINLEGNLTPVFDLPIQADRCIQKRCGGSKYLRIVELEKEDE